MPSFDSNALLAREVELQKRLLELEKTEALTFFRPHAKQSLFFAAASFHYRYARTGNRFGKSEMGAAEDIAFALGYRPWIPEGDPLRTLGIPAKPTKGLIITTDWDKSKEVFTEKEGTNLGKLFRYIPHSAFVSDSKNHSGAIDRIVIKHVSGGNSVIHLDTVKSYKQNAMGQESSVWDWVHVDEPIPKGMWEAVSRGLVDRCGKAWFTCTPIAEAWIDEKFIPDTEMQTRENLPTVSDVEKSTFMMTGTMDDNPHLTQEAIQRFMNDLEPEVREARRNGIPLAYSGLVYKEFKWNEHVLQNPPPGWTSWENPPADYTVRIALDYHYKKPNAVLFIATSPQEISYVFAELWRESLVDEDVREIKRILSGRDYQPIRMDPLASTPNKVTDTTAMDEYRRLGLAVLPATKDPANGIRAVKATLKARTKNGLPVLYVNPACKRFLMEIARGFIFDPTKDDKPLKKNDDMMENLYRLCLEGLTYIEPALVEDYYTPKVLPDPVQEFSLSDFGGLDDDWTTERKRPAGISALRYRR